MDDLPILPAQSRAARGLLGLDRAALAAMAAMPEEALARFEDEAGGLAAAQVAALRHAFETAGVLFVDAGAEGPGVRLRGVRGSMDGIRPEELSAANDD